MLLWFSRLPLTLRLPLVVAVMIFVVAVATTQAAIQSSSNQFAQQMERIGQVYLDGLSAAVMPAVARNDVPAMTAILGQALLVHVGIQDRRLAILDAESQIVARAERADGPDSPVASPPDSATLPAEITGRAQGMFLNDGDSSVWVWRPLPLTETTAGFGTIVANLDVTSFISERRRLRWSLLLFDLLFSGLCAVIGFYVARHLQRPVTLLTEHLRLGTGHLPRPVPRELIPAHDPQTSQLIEAFNRMANDAHQREAMLGRLMDQERDAILGRMAATLAHEIRNPLGGISTAIQTLRKFGEKPETRAEALDFIERGVVALQDVTDATLKTHRPADSARMLRRQDLRDVQVLVAADAARHGVTVELDTDMPLELPVAATEIRQLLLNLLLNAVRATSAGGNVTLRSRLNDKILQLEVIDQGQGLAPELAHGLMSGFSPPGNVGLGVAVIVRLVERLQGRVSVNARSGGGTHITLSVPLLEVPATTQGDRSSDAPQP